MIGLRSVLAPEPPREVLREFTLSDGTSTAVRWVRDTRARRLRLIVGERGVRLTLPRRASIRLAEAFLQEHRDWLTRQLAQQRPTVLRPPMRRGEDVLLPLRGDEWPVAWREGRYARAEREESGVVIALPPRATDQHLRAALRDFYTREARADLGAWLPRYLPGLPRAPLAFRLRPMSSLWGSLSPGDALTLDLSLVLGRPSAFEYVLVHELCHLIHRDHSRRFWREVEARTPDWWVERDYLHGDGLLLKREMARLVVG
jgi:predicted metal-dependent hydrolase